MILFSHYRPQTRSHLSRYRGSMGGALLPPYFLETTQRKGQVLCQ